MAQLFEFEGQQYSFPDDATQEEIFGFLDHASPAPAPEGPSEEGFLPQLKGSFLSTLTEGNPRLGARAVEGLGRAFGSETMTQWGSETAKEYDESPDKFVPREPDALEAILSGELGRIGDALGSGL